MSKLIETVTAIPKSQIQRCIIHQIRLSTRYVSYKNIKSLMTDLKKVYQAVQNRLFSAAPTSSAHSAASSNPIL